MVAEAAGPEEEVAEAGKEEAVAVAVRRHSTSAQVFVLMGKE